MAALRVACAKRNVTPPMGVALGGYGLKPERTAGAVLDDLFARAIVLDDGQRKIVLASVDIIGMSSALATSIRARVEKETGIPAAAILISVIHSHSAPTAAFYRQWGALDPAYIGTLERQVGDAIIEAAGKVKPAEFGFGQAEVKGIAINRVRKDGPVDHTLRVFGARDPQTRKLSVAATNFSCHPVHMPPDSRFVSADYPGRLVRDLERDFPGAAGVFFQGTLGDINPEGTFSGADAAFEHGSMLAAAARQVLEGMEMRSNVEVNFAQVDCAMPLDFDTARREALEFLLEGKTTRGHDYLARTTFMREWSHEILGLVASNPSDRLHCEVPALRIGDAAIVGLPGEIYTLIAQTIRAESPFKNTWIVGFTNGAVGYVADPRDYAEMTYAAQMTPKIYGHPPFKPEAWRVLADAGVQALKKL